MGVIGCHNNKTNKETDRVFQRGHLDPEKEHSQFWVRRLLSGGLALTDMRDLCCAE